MIALLEAQAKEEADLPRRLGLELATLDLFLHTYEQVRLGGLPRPLLAPRVPQPPKSLSLRVDPPG